MAESPIRDKDMASGSSPSTALFTSPGDDQDSANGSPRAASPAAASPRAANRQPAPPRMLPPPHGRRFPTEETAEAFLKHFSISAGYKIVRKRSAGKGKDGKIIAYECHLSGHPRGGRTKKIGCPFRISLDCLKRTNYEYEINSMGVRQHNHGPDVKDPSRAHHCFAL
ncbi:hypothetical protein KVR01_010329 [Diaporthe batatas]|uniref:uncharacterized protein n=1 Tax=Diaporthe batatas TaxID=748121 RepID=UPI001D04CCC9|nr:uncharacterized protein KVR01_010329 [Diaporthe batatas]KAG8159692.1 hypothetical protein KVR01_010329 [Diaporthe batatas]